MPDGAAAFAWPPRAMPIKAAAYYVGLSPSTFRAEVAPTVAPVRLSRGRVGWLREDLDRWLDARRLPADAAPQAPEPAAHAARDPFAAALAALPPARRARRQAPPA